MLIRHATLAHNQLVEANRLASNCGEPGGGAWAGVEPWQNLVKGSCMKLAVTSVLTAIAGAWCSQALGMGQPDPQPFGSPTGIPLPISPADIAKINEMSDAERAKVREESSKLINAAQLACDPVSAAQVGHSDARISGKSVELKAYEVVCGNGMGYFIASQGPERPLVMSCFAADATHAASLANGDKSDLFCQLKANKDIKAMAAALLAKAGTSCDVNSVRWYGIVVATGTEYTEVACADGRGYLLKNQQINPGASVSAMSCEDAAGQNLHCRLSKGGPPPAQVMTDRFKRAITQNGVACDALQIRLVGRETVSRRYVVEAQCPEQPDGLVAFIPLDDPNHQFESMDCAAAAEHHVTCALQLK
jgi:hypothetical protein